MQEIPQEIRLKLKEAKDLLETGGMKAAEEAREKLLDLSDANGYPIYHLLLAKAAKELNQQATAIAHLEKSLEFDEKNIQAVIRVAESRIKNGEQEKAAELLEKAVELVEKTGDPKIGCKIAALLIRSGRGTKAIEMLEELKEINPNNKEVAYTLGLAYRDKGDNESYVKESIAAIQRSSLEKSIKQRVSLSKHFIMDDGYGKALGLLTPLKELERSCYPNESSMEILSTLTALCYVEIKAVDAAKECIIGLQNQSSIGANYVWARIQIEENDIDMAYKSAQAIKTLANKQCNQLENRKKRAKEIMESDAKHSLKQKGERIASISADGLESLGNTELSAEKESIVQFLDVAKHVLMASVPG